MASLAEMYPQMPEAHRVHLLRLARTWAPLADISFADLLLCVPDTHGEAPAYTVVDHVRPTTARSLYRTEMQGARFPSGSRPFFDLARATGTIVDGGMILQPVAPRIRSLIVPVTCDGEVIAVLAREFSPDEQRDPGELEMNYFFTFRRLAQMIADGVYPFADDDFDLEESPRVSDGLMLIDASARVRFASPNAISVLSRIGVRGVEGQRLSTVGVDTRAVRRAFDNHRPHGEEIESGDHSVVLRCIPLLDAGELTGAVLLMRDVSELRRRDRLLLSKDATIAEIHHRVKNNLQTISSLLRLQGRRVVADEARHAIDDSVRRIRSIAVVHELLSQEVSSDLPFQEVVRPLVRLVEESFSSPDQPLRFTVSGEAGELPSDVATPLAVVLSELMQNAVEHGFPEDQRKGASVEIRFASSAEGIEAWVIDNGAGVDRGFDLDSHAGLGLTIVRGLVENDLGGELTVQTAPGLGSGTGVRVWVPRPAETGLAAAVGRDSAGRS
jgi:two-component sensor histidine kinase